MGVRRMLYVLAPEGIFRGSRKTSACLIGGGSEGVFKKLQKVNEKLFNFKDFLNFGKLIRFTENFHFPQKFMNVFEFFAIIEPKHWKIDRFALITGWGRATIGPENFKNHKSKGIICRNFPNICAIFAISEANLNLNNYLQ